MATKDQDTNSKVLVNLTLSISELSEIRDALLRTSNLKQDAKTGLRKVIAFLDKISR